MPPLPKGNSNESLSVEFPFEHRIFQLNSSPFSDEQLKAISEICVSQTAQFLVFQDTTASDTFDNAIMFFYPIPKYGEEIKIYEALDSRNVVASIVAANPNLELRDSGFFSSERQDLYGIAPLLSFILVDEFKKRTLMWREHLRNTLGINVFPLSRFE